MFCGFHGTILEGFWGHLEVENRLGDSMGALFSLELDFPGSSLAILEGFGDNFGVMSGSETVLEALSEPC